MLALQIAAAVLAVIGAYSLIRAAGEAFFTPRSLTAAVLVTSPEDVRNLDLLLREAERCSLRAGRHRPVVLIDRALLQPACGACPGCGERAPCRGEPCPGAGAEALLSSRGIRWYPADLTGTPDRGGISEKTGS